MPVAKERDLVAGVATSLAKTISRREALDKGFRVASGALFVFLLGPSSASAMACETDPDCSCVPPGAFCANCPETQAGGCPPGCSVCTTGEGLGCIYEDGFWVASCDGTKTAKCYDCKCGPNFEDTCGCCSQSTPDPSPPGGDPPRCGGGPCQDKG